MIKEAGSCMRALMCMNVYVCVVVGVKQAENSNSI